MATSMELKADRDLINPNFEGYKLSLDKLPIYDVSLEHAVDVVALGEDQYSYHHAKLFGVHNHLIQDPWNQRAVYFVDSDWSITAVQAQESSVELDRKVYRLPDAEKHQGVFGRLNVSITFISEDTAVIGDGAGRVHIVHTGSRAELITWKTLLSRPVNEDSQPCMLVDAVLVRDGAAARIECLLAHVSESTPEQKDKYSSQFLTVLEWITFVSADGKTWSEERRRQLIGRRPFHYVCLGRAGDSITLAGEAEFKFTNDSEIPVVSDGEEKESTEPRPPDYTWTQTDEEVDVQFTLPEPTEKAAIFMNLRRDHIELGVKNKTQLLLGPLCGEVDVEGSTWTIDGRRLDVHLCKKSPGKWPLVVDGDTRGELLPDLSHMASVHGRLAQLTSEEWNPSPDKEKKPFNTQQLEECDMFPDDDSTMVRLDGNTHKVTHRIGLGSHQWLFTVQGEENHAPLICLRHDVDGLLWKPETNQSGDPIWKHCATLNAFGYVQASKQQKKFSTCSPDFSYALICDVQRHIYLYRQSTPVLTPLRNRKTGQQVNAVAKQQVITLENTDTIVGVVATNDRFFIATQNKLFMVKV